MEDHDVRYLTLFPQIWLRWANSLCRYSEILDYHNVEAGVATMEGQEFNGQ